MALTNDDILRATELALRQHGAVLREATYEPRVWNDEGVYTHFYIDFKGFIAPASTGMFAESVIVHDSVQLTITAVQQINATTYKIFCDISGKVSGITVLNKKTSLLTFTDGTKVKPFATHFYVAGIVPYVKMDYGYDAVEFSDAAGGSHLESVLTNAWTLLPNDTITEAATFSSVTTALAVELITATLT